MFGTLSASASKMLRLFALSTSFTLANNVSKKRVFRKLVDAKYEGSKVGYNEYIDLANAMTLT